MATITTATASRQRRLRRQRRASRRWAQIQSSPTALAGLALGLASLGSCWDQVLAAEGRIAGVMAVLAALPLLLVLLKFASRPRLWWQELADPLIGSVLPTIAMASMVIAKALGTAAPAAGEVLWRVAVILHLLTLAGFVLRQLPRFAVARLLPSWFVPPVGIIVAVVTAPPALAGQPLLAGLWQFGVCAYLLLLPLVLCRLALSAPLCRVTRPSLAILAAPASLSLVGYLATHASPDPVVVAVLATLALVMTAVVVVALLVQLRHPFVPSLAAFTFPLVISATACFALARQLAQWPLTLAWAGRVEQLAWLELLLATAVVAYVALAFIRRLPAATAVARPTIALRG